MRVGLIGVLWAVVSMALSTTACGGGDQGPEIICKPNYAVGCFCEDGLEGEQVCNPQGTAFLAECLCVAPPVSCETAGCPPIENGRVTCIDGECEIACDEGFTGVNGCFDLNECSTNDGGCDHICTNTPGNFQCSCDEGYYLLEDQLNCEEINPCDTDNGGCHELAICTFKKSEMSCACPDGFDGDGMACADIDECAQVELNNCDLDATCTNNAGSFECTCNEGFEGIGTVCADIDECAENNGNCEGSCLNVPGSYSCDCDPGYAVGPGGEDCEDVNECAEENGGCGQICTNTDGSHECTCSSGFFLSPDGFLCEGLTVDGEGLTWSRHVIRDQYCAIGTVSGMNANALEWNTSWCGLGDDALPPGDWRLPTKSKLMSIISLYGSIESFIIDFGFINNTVPGSAVSVWTQSPGTTPGTHWVLHLEDSTFSEVNDITHGDHWMWVIHDQ